MKKFILFLLFLLAFNSCNLFLGKEEVKTYAITFIANGGVGDNITQQIREKSTSPLKTNTFVRDGYNFKSWNTSVNGSGTSYLDNDNYTMGNQDITLYAQWSIKKHILSFDSNGGSNSMSPLTIAEGSKTILPPGEFTKVGFFFHSWNTKINGDGETYLDRAEFTMGSADATLYAQWSSVPTYTVTFNGNSVDVAGTMIPQIFNEGESKDLTANSYSRPGYKFTGWNTDPLGGGVSYLDSSTLLNASSNIDLYAQWEINPTYTITFNSNYGTVTTTTQDIVEGLVSNLNMNSFTNPGHYFVSWNTESTGNGVSYSDGAEYLMGNSPVTLYAIWAQNDMRTVTFNSNYGVNAVSTQNIIEGTTEALRSNTFVRAGYTFSGWSTTVNGAVEYPDSSNITPGATDIALYAQWTLNLSHNVVFNANGGVGSMSSQSIVEGLTSNLTPNTFVKSGYRFVGWSSVLNGDVVYLDNSDIVMGSADINLYAKWELKPTYTITFDVNSGTGAMIPQSIPEGEVDTIKANTFTKPGFTFKGWTKDQLGSGTLYLDGSDFLMGTSSIVLYAQWIEEPKFISKWRVTNNKLQFPLDGNLAYDFTVDWGDGTSEHITYTYLHYIEHTYTSNGDYTVTITGSLSGFGYNESFRLSQRSGSLLDILQWGNVQIRDGGYQFSYCSLLEGFSATDFPDTSNITDMNRMFMSATAFNGDLSKWNTSNVRDMGWMFYEAYLFNSNIGSWDTSKVTNMFNMFTFAREFNQDLSLWSTGAVTNMGGMFCGAKKFNQNLTNWDTSKVTTMGGMFNNASAFNGDISKWKTNNVTDMSSMFIFAKAFSQDLSKWDTGNVRDMSAMFCSAPLFNADLSGWDTKSVTNMSSMFSGAKLFNSDLSLWVTTSVTKMGSMFEGAFAFNGDVSTWDTSSVTDMSFMFRSASIFNKNLSNWKTGNVTDMRSMFSSAYKFNQDISRWDTSKVTNMYSMFFLANEFNQDISGWITTNVTDMNSMFDSAAAFNCGNIDLTTWVWDTTNVIDKERMFVATLVDTTKLSWY